LSAAAHAAQDERINSVAKIPPLLGALLLAVLLGACSPNVPTAKRGSVETYQDGRMVSSRELVEPEARAVTAWFKTNGSGWSWNTGASPPALMIRVKHSNFETTVINLSGTTVIVTNSSGQFKKILTPAEAAQLRELAGEPPAP
jgi:hypothetical protein